MRSYFFHLQHIALPTPVFSLKIQMVANWRNHCLTLLFTAMCFLLLPWDTLVSQADIRAITSNSFCCSLSLCVNSDSISVCSWQGTKEKQPLTCVEPLLTKQHPKRQWTGQMPQTWLLCQVSWMVLCPLSICHLCPLRWHTMYLTDSGVGKRTPYNEQGTHIFVPPQVHINSWARNLFLLLSLFCFCLVLFFIP